MTTEKSSRFQLIAQSPRVAAFRSWLAQKWVIAKAILASEAFTRLNFMVAVYCLFALVILKIGYARRAIGQANQTLELIRQGTVTKVHVLGNFRHKMALSHEFSGR